MDNCSDPGCRLPLTEHDLAIGICGACGKMIKADAQDLLERHRKNLKHRATHVKIVETMEPEEPR